MFVITAICGASEPIERSDSSPSTTSQPVADAGVAAELRNHAADDPGRVAAGLAAARRRSSPTSSSCRGRRRRRSPAARRRARPGTSARGVPSMRCRWAVETITSQPAGGAGSPPRSTSMPSSDAMKIVSRDVPPAHLGAERPGDVRVGGHARAADADEVQPPPRERPRRSGPRPRQRRASAITPSAIRSAASTRAIESIAARISREPRGIGEQLGDERRAPPRSPRRGRRRHRRPARSGGR